MEHSLLVVSDPPHHEVDHNRAGELLGLTPAEIRMKANFPAPEVWLAFPDAEEATDATSSLGGTGLNTAVVDGKALSTVPGPAPVSSFAFTDETFLARFQEGELELRYDAPTFGVFCKPPPGFSPAQSAQSSRSSKRRRTTLAWTEKVAGAGHESGRLGAVELLTNLDLYLTTDGKISRVSIIQESADFSGLGDLKKPASDANMEVFLSECERLFNRLTLDARLKNIRPRQRPQVRKAAGEKEGRRLFSFGTWSLRRLLESIDQELRDLTQFELGSRLAFLMNRQAEGGP